MKLLGVDTGGTFTDFVLYEHGRLTVHKVLSTPAAPERAILKGIEDLGLADDADMVLIHGSTVATNAVLEGKGVRTAFITNRGLADLLTLGRQARDDLYDMQPRPVAPPVPPELCFELAGRVGADGGVVEALDDKELAALTERLRRTGVRAVAVNLLFSFLDDRFERAVAKHVPPGVFVSCSSDVLPEYKEYERGVATWLNAWVGPLVEGYLDRLTAGLPEAAISVMQSSGTTIEAGQAGRRAVNMLLSGPAGGLAGARFMGRNAGRERLLTFDMGGTSTDVALIEGRLLLTSDGRIGRYPVAVPQVDMHTIGAGGGSIASVDEGGLLRVGPESAGADPGPACYGAGGDRPTVTDANLVLGRLRPDAFLGGGMPLDSAAARRAVGATAAKLGLSVEQAAEGIIRIANEHMARALRVMSVQRGVDPRSLTLVSFGGAGGLHVCALAEAIGMVRAMVPVHAGVLSAFGMLAAPRGRQLSRTLRAPLDALGADRLEREFAALFDEGAAMLAAEGVGTEALHPERGLDLRYRGQSYTLTVAWTGRITTAAEAFHEAHQARYGHRLDLPVELVNLRLGLAGPEPRPALETVAARAAPPVPELITMHGVNGEAELWRRGDLRGGDVVEGPALITETVSTTFLAPRWRAMVDPSGNLMLESR